MNNKVFAIITLIFLCSHNSAYSESDKSALKSESCNNINDSYIQDVCVDYNKRLISINTLQNKLLSSLDEKRKKQYNTEKLQWEQDVGKFCSKDKYDTEMYYNRFGCLSYFTTEREKVLSYYQKNGYKISENLTGTYTWKENNKNIFTMNTIDNSKIGFEFIVAQPRGESFHFGHAEGKITLLKNKAVYNECMN